MTEALPIACSLGAGELQERLQEIAAVGAESLVNESKEDGEHVLRFRSDSTTRQELEKIVAAEAECCAFLNLDLREDLEELVLTISAPPDAKSVAEELARAFSTQKRAPGSR